MTVFSYRHDLLTARDRAYETFIDLWNNDEDFLWTVQRYLYDSTMFRKDSECGEFSPDNQEAVFECLWNFDSTGFVSDPHECLDCYITYFKENPSWDLERNPAEDYRDIY